MRDFSTADHVSPSVASFLQQLLEAFGPSPDVDRRVRELDELPRQYLVLRAQMFVAVLYFSTVQQADVLTLAGKQSLVDEWHALNSGGRNLGGLMRTSNKDFH